MKVNFEVTIHNFFKNIFITFHQFHITKLKFEEITILKQPDVYVLLHFQHFSTNSQIDQI